MRLKSFDRNHRVVTLEGSTAAVAIYPTPLGSRKPGWIVKVEVVHEGYTEPDSGARHFTDEELASAFGLSDYVDTGLKFVGRYGAHAGKQGTYIRQGRYLNIPCPGTGGDGDPNVSICISDEIASAVKELLRLT